MSRTATKVHTKDLQDIINAEEATCQEIGQTDFFKRCAEKYNETHVDKITHSVIYLRVKGGIVHTNISGKKGKRKLTPEHLAKLQAGRQSTATRVKKDYHGTPYADRLKERYPDRPNAVEKVLNGSLANAVALKCWECCCGDREAIRECSAFACPLFNFRPYK